MESFISAQYKGENMALGKDGGSDIPEEFLTEKDKKMMGLETEGDKPLEANAKEVWLKAAEQVSDDGLFLSRKGDYYKKAGDDQKAEEMWEQAVEWEESNGYDSKAAKTYEKLGNEDKAKELWLQAAENASQKEHAAEYYERAGEIDKAKEIMQDFVASQESKIEDGDTNVNYELIAEIYGKLNNTDKAKDMWLKAAEKQAEEGLLLEHQNYAKAAGLYRKGGDEAKAVEKLEAAAQKVEGDPLNAAELYEKAGNEAKAKEFWQKFLDEVENGDLRYDNKKPEVYEAHMKLGNEAKAKEIMLKHIELSSEYEHFSDAAEGFEKLGDNNKAKEMWEKAAEKEATDGNYEKAAEIYEQIISKEQIVKVIPQENKDYFSAMEDKHFHPEKAIGSLFTETKDLNELLQKTIEQRGDLDGDDREEFIKMGVPKEALMEQCRYLKVDTKGEMGMVKVADLASETKVKVVKTKPDTPASLVVEQGEFPTVDYGTIVIGPNEKEKDADPEPSTKEMVWTVHPGLPVRPAREDIWPEGDVITASDVVKELGGDTYLNVERAKKED